MSEPDPDNKGDDPESMFDFLDEHDERRPYGQRSSATSKEPTPLPVIREPVPVAESGPLRAPRAGEPFVLEPAYLTDGRRVDVDRQPDTPPRASPRPLPRAPIAAVAPRSPAPDARDDASQRAPDNVTPFPGTARNVAAPPGQVRDELDPDDTQRLSRPAGRSSRSQGVDELDENLGDDLNDDLAFLAEPPLRDPAPRSRSASSDGFIESFDDDVLSGVHHVDRAPGGRWRVIAGLFGVILVLAGAGLLAQRYLLELDQAPLVASGADDAEPAVPTDADAPTGQPASVSLGDRFRERLAAIQGLLDSGQIDDAAVAIDALDRAVYGYGAAEFGDMEARIAAYRATGELPPASATAERFDAARLAVQQRAAEQQQATAAEEAERIAAAEEAERAAAEQQRLAQQAEAAREAEAAARAAAEQSAREEAERVAAAEAAEQRAAEQRAAEQRAAEARAATDRRIAAQRAEAQQRAAAEQARRDRAEAEARVQRQRAVAREQQLQRERVIAERQAAARAEAAAERLARAAPAETPTPRAPAQTAIMSRPIDDDDLQTVYRQFASLEAAIESRDINQVISLTKPSGARVQQFLQLFQNSQSIDARITGVATRNVSGSITGTLRIDSVELDDGRRVAPSDALASITLTSQRSDSGWSTIEW